MLTQRLFELLKFQYRVPVSFILRNAQTRYATLFAGKHTGCQLFLRTARENESVEDRGEENFLYVPPALATARPLSEFHGVYDDLLAPTGTVPAFFP